MYITQMVITRSTIFKSLQTNPAGVNLATRTLYMVTAVRFVHQSLASRTILDVVFKLERLHCLGVE